MKYYLDNKEVTQEQLEQALLDVHLRDLKYYNICWEVVLCNIEGDKMYFETCRF